MQEKLLTYFQNKINYYFKNINLLEQALTHRSAASDNNERLEFLGDALVNLLVGDVLFSKFPKAKEGQLSRLRASLVSGEALAELARELELPDFLKLGGGEIKTGGRHRESILAGAMEAVIGAVYRDSDFATCREKVLSWYESRFNGLDLDQQSIDSKTALQEYLQAQKKSLPIYEVIEQSGKSHDQVFKVQCIIEELGVDQAEIGMGSNRRKAEQQAAKLMLEKLKNDNTK